MGLVALALLWMGYSTAYYGYNRITGGNDKFISLVWPGRYSPTARDDGSGASASGTGTGTTTAGTGAAKVATTATAGNPGTGQTVPGRTVQPS